ncbi:hypothetical protein COV82_06500 [Candidatus Peregrinibacteria bacterium CG11_big_fil_rev_8_21_14_0_20_46_8]|nr:MAG: hypothetical protein COV82_06500 [Candidatus Peregrinibacteria bacterium CG11_big_fil_rev_8_21_14_0_20_46_8]
MKLAKKQVQALKAKARTAHLQQKLKLANRLKQNRNLKQVLNLNLMMKMAPLRQRLNRINLLPQSKSLMQMLNLEMDLLQLA